MSALTPAQEEAYAYVRTDDLWLLGVILEHAMVSFPLNFIDGYDQEVSLPPDDLGSPNVLFKPTSFSFKAPSASVKEGPGEGQLQIDGVSGEIRDAARWAGVDGNPVLCTVLVYQIKLVNGVPNFNIGAPHQRYSGLRIEKISLTATSASASLKVREWGNTNFPRELYDREKYPALHG